uniref:(northern house mosquito) hypothetical protein n=1 Tax=Culex pipiens TaxID=7175 RepID=A0A8D8EYS2_CULPI
MTRSCPRWKPSGPRRERRSSLDRAAGRRSRVRWTSSCWMTCALRVTRWPTDRREPISSMPTCCWPNWPGTMRRRRLITGRMDRSTLCSTMEWYRKQQEIFSTNSSTL